MRVASLTAVLFAFWLALSGHYTPFLMLVGLAAALLVAGAAWRTRIVDDEGHPIELLPAALTYFPWLAREVAGSALQVARIIVDPRLPIAPTVVALRASQETPAGIATYANSITLTPGTITLAVHDRALTVHALTGDGAHELMTGVTVFDRVLAGNAIGSLAVLLVAVLGFLRGRPEFLDIGLTYGLLNIIGTLAVLKFFRHGDLAQDAAAREGER
jgi:multicomponent Na+:H+ antiporter subunit E